MFALLSLHSGIIALLVTTAACCPANNSLHKSDRVEVVSHLNALIIGLSSGI